MINKLRTRSLKASFTVEAAVVMAIVIFVFVYMIKFSFSLRDSVFGNIELNEAVELFGHKNEEDNTDVAAYGNERLKNILEGRELSMEIDEEGDGCRGVLYGSEQIKSITDKGFKPQKTMRRITLIEELKGKS